MVTVITATNRPNNTTQLFAEKYIELLEARGVDARHLSMEALPASFGLSNIYDYHHPEFFKLLEQFIIPADTLVVLIPEYNAGIPGVFKVFLDAVKPSLLSGKRAALVGISSGRSGNIRGIDNLTNIFHYLNLDVLPYKLPISRVNELLDEKKRIMDESTIKAMNHQIDKLLGK
jgi:chromate reductase, NAD(P)H dehydrogenase (quinone)